MTNEEAKFILSAYRPDGSDAADPAMKEALDQAARDPELAAWFQQERAFDAAVSQKLNEVPVPAELKPSILVGRRMMAVPTRKVWSWGPLLRLAAGFVIFFGVIWLLSRPAPAGKLGEFRSDMVARLSAGVAPLDFGGTSVDELRTWLAAKGGIEPEAISTALEQRPTLGCRVLDWRGAQVTLVCFDAGEGRVTHLVVVDRAVFPDLKETLSPEAIHLRDWTVVNWTTEEHVYLLAGSGKRPELEKLL